MYGLLVCVCCACDPNERLSAPSICSSRGVVANAQDSERAG